MLINDLIQREGDIMFKLFKKSSNEMRDSVDSIKGSIKRFEDKVDKLEKDNKKLQRILECGRDDAITYKTIKGDFFYLCYRNAFTYSYKDGQEYKLDNLCLHEPKFTQGDIKHIIFVKDSVGEDDKSVEEEYVIDLSNCSFTQIK